MSWQFINIVSSNRNNIIEFCKLIENRYDNRTLTGLNYAELRDGTFLLGLIFKDSPEVQKAVLETAKHFAFDKVYTEEERWAEIVKLAKISVLGNFSYKMFGIGGL